MSLAFGAHVSIFIRQGVLGLAGFSRGGYKCRPTHLIIS